MRINHNLSSLTTQSALFKSNRTTTKSLEKLSTGLRINSAADDAAGLAVSENLRTQVRGLSQAAKNTQDVISMLNIADGALNEITDIMHRMRELVIQAKNDTYTQEERDYMGKEFYQLMEEIDRIAASTNFNGMELFAAPEKEGLNAGSQMIYTADTTGTPKKIGQAKNIFGSGYENDSVLGENDNGSSNHFNMWIGANVNSEDLSSYYSSMKSYRPDANNGLTIQLGQMDCNALLTTDPSLGNFYADASKLWGDGNGNSFTWKNTIGGGDVEDAILDYHCDGNIANNTVQVKFDLLLQIIDGTDSTPQSDYFSGMVSNASWDANAVSGLERVNRTRAYIGAMTNRLEHALNNTMSQLHHQQAAESIIRDADFALETSSFTKNQILTQSGTAMLAQANMQSSAVLSLIQ